MARLSWMVLPTLVLAALVSCGDSEDTLEAVDESSLVRIVTGDTPGTLDPHKTSNGADSKIFDQMYESLLKFDLEDANIVRPCLAESYTVSDDSKLIAFKIREGVKFHDGESLNASAAKLSIDRVRTLTLAAYRSEFATISKVEADGMTLKVYLSEPTPRIILRNLAMFASSIVSPAVIKEANKLGDKESVAYVASHFAGTGPFVLKSFRENQPVMLKAFDNYWGGAPAIDTLVFQRIKEAKSRYSQFKSGQAEVVDDMPRTEWKSLGDRMKSWTSMNVCYLAINVKHEKTKDPRVRRAIQLAINREEILGAYYGTATPAYVMLPPTMAEHEKGFRADGLEKSLEERQAAAKKLVNEAGVADQKLVIRYPQDPRPYLPEPLNTADFLRQQLRAAGFSDVEIQPELNDSYFQETKEGKWELMLLGWMSDNGDPDNFYSMLMSGNPETGKPNPYNAAHAVDAEATKLILDAQKLSEISERVSTYRKIERRLRSQMVAHIPLVYAKQGMAIQDYLTGVTIDALGRYSFAKAKLEKRSR